MIAGVTGLWVNSVMLSFMTTTCPPLSFSRLPKNLEKVSLGCSAFRSWIENLLEASFLRKNLF